MNDESRLSLPNTARLSPAAIPKMPIDTVPLRDLALAPTESYEAVSAGHKSAPPIAESPWEFGAVQPDLIFRACTDIVLEPPMAGPGVLQP
ncbi:hypothetical protein N7462_002243 [Penicillium macrosclerotiorum]|uniref:uncharacterized protein n=1 Tax=Penicillium macrosclerotiorum TaxID=303699 RepID=UPI002548943B|nr:uncharacterized protein N7462_002243 [Penicillium macrosclerotiorum]KAJ5692820.1 hypothetical protein N7462_002243 [Penicillium macrosclerotiorum]